MCILHRNRTKRYNLEYVTNNQHLYTLLLYLNRAKRQFEASIIEVKLNSQGMLVWLPCTWYCSLDKQDFFCAVKNQGAQEDLTPNNQEASGASDLHQTQHQDSASGSHEQSHTVLEGHRMTSDIYNTVVPFTDTKGLPVQLTDVLHSAQQTLISKLRWATQELEATSSVDHATQLCRLIKECTDALKSMRELPLQNHPHPPPVKLSV